MRADRLIALVLLLQARGRMTAEALAMRLEVSVRTVYRDLDALSAAGVPVYAACGRGGGVELPDGFRLDLNALNPEEARAVFLGGVAAPLAELGVGAVLDGALRKLAAALSAPSRDAAERTRQRLLVDTSDWWQPPPPTPPALRTIEEAIWRDRRLRLTYGRYGRGETERIVDPYALIAKRGVWYLVGAVTSHAADASAGAPPGSVTSDWRTSRGIRAAGASAGVPAARSDVGNNPAALLDTAEEPRSSDSSGARPLAKPVVYRLSRVRSAVLLDEPSQRPTDFDLARFWAEWCVEFLASRPHYFVTLRGDRAVVARLTRTFAVVDLPPALEGQEGQPEGDRVVVQVDLETPEVACSTLLGCGPAVEALAPPELRRLLARTAADTLALYGHSG
ncbi:MAG: WYL domain-containing protein [Chloroflexota bacterium]|nr:WYL domain-containing protein [Chloroflexota bacterium]